MSESEIAFEQAFGRLEEILKKMNSGHVTLDESLSLYEEADKLIALCNKRLNQAETRIETLLKKRNGELELDPAGKPRVEEFKE